jgi:hypothetical protein
MSREAGIRFEQKVREILLICGFLLIIAVAPLAAILTGVFWLKTKSLPDWSISAFGYSSPVTEWKGANYLIDGFYHLHPFWLALLFGCLIFWMGTQVSRPKKSHAQR